MLYSAGILNCPDIDWSSHTVDSDGADRQTQQMLIDIAQRFNLDQIHEQPTRGENLLDLVFYYMSDTCKELSEHTRSI